MSLTLYFHPLASYCHKVLIALYENGVPFRGEIVDLADETANAEFLALWPVGKIPILRDEGRGRIVPETASSSPEQYFRPRAPQLRCPAALPP